MDDVAMRAHNDDRFYDSVTIASDIVAQAGDTKNGTDDNAARSSDSAVWSADTGRTLR
jgi:hypothetical protein